MSSSRLSDLTQSIISKGMATSQTAMLESNQSNLSDLQITIQDQDQLCKDALLIKLFELFNQIQISDEHNENLRIEQAELRACFKKVKKCAHQTLQNLNEARVQAEKIKKNLKPTKNGNICHSSYQYEDTQEQGFITAYENSQATSRNCTFKETTSQLDSNKFLESQDTFRLTKTHHRRGASNCVQGQGISKGLQRWTSSSNSKRPFRSTLNSPEKQKVYPNIAEGNSRKQRMSENCSPQSKNNQFMKIQYDLSVRNSQQSDLESKPLFKNTHHTASARQWHSKTRNKPFACLQQNNLSKKNKNTPSIPPNKSNKYNQRISLPTTSTTQPNYYVKTNSKAQSIAWNEKIRNLQSYSPSQKDLSLNLNSGVKSPRTIEQIWNSQPLDHNKLYKGLSKVVGSGTGIGTGSNLQKRGIKKSYLHPN